ncbi:MAG: hypothetical protein Q9170_006189 [Blastenia crenularia]
MASADEHSPRPFNVADSQADMSWLEDQHDRAQIPTDGNATGSISPLDLNPTRTADVDNQSERTHTPVNVGANTPVMRSHDTSHTNPTGRDIDRSVPGISIPDISSFTLPLAVEALTAGDVVEPDGQHHSPIIKVEEPSVDLTFDDDDEMVKKETGRWTEIRPGHIDIWDSDDELPQPAPVDSTSNATQKSEVHNEETHGISQPQQSAEAVDTSAVNTVSPGDRLDVPSSSAIRLGDSILHTRKPRTKKSEAEIARLKELQAEYRAKVLSRGQGAIEETASIDPAVQSRTEVVVSDNEDRIPPNRGTDVRDEVDSLFIPQHETPNRKRPLAATVETDKEDNDQDVQEIDGSTVPDTRGKPKRKRQPKPQPLSEEASKQLQESEQHASLATMLESFSAKPGKAQSSNKRDLRGKPDRGHSAAKTPKLKRKEKKASGQGITKPKAKKSSKKSQTADARMKELVQGLQSHDVVAEANANLEREALPSFDERDKQKYLKALLSTVPDDDRPGVRGEKTRLYKAATSFGHGAVTSTGSGWRMKGMKSILLHHQLLGASFMRKRELGTEQPHGGLLADEMGFGKTVMMIANMVTNPPQASEKRKSTLIVCSPALMLQWQRELSVHASDNIFRKILIHHGSSKQEGEGCKLVLEEADVVLTTYGQVMQSFPLSEPPDHLETAEEQRAWISRNWVESRGPLHRAQFYRVVLDEAQAIKNHRSHTSIACVALMARYRWAISGTPIMNRLEELYPYFKFLRVGYSGSFDAFKKNFCGGRDRLFTDRLQACLSTFMIRRTHKDMIFGKPIIKLPECHPKTIMLSPTKVEIFIYRAVEMRYAYAVNAMASRISEEHLKRLIMAMITRLRQMTAHIFLVQHIMQDMFEVEDIQHLWRLVKDEATGRETLEAVRGLIDNKADDEESDEEPSASTDIFEEYAQPSEALLQRFQQHLRSLITDSDSAEFAKRSTCSRCGAPPDSPYVTSCLHVYCHECLIAMATQAAEKDEDGVHCLECNTAYTSSMPCTNVKELNYNMGAGLGEADKSPRKRHKPPKDLLKWIRKDGGTLSSTKTAAVIAQVEQWLTEEPDKKIIVFSQWHMMMQIVVQDCKKHRWGYCTYHGNMSNKQRDKAIEEFGTDPEKRVMVASLKCGGLGLNLTMASKIICVDLWFNSFVEQQAFCRIFRIGQESETYINRFVLKNTVDERLIELQERKKKLIGRALGDTEAFKHFSAEDLMRLFGTVRHDEHDHPFIVMENQAEIVGEEAPVGT